MGLGISNLDEHYDKINENYGKISEHYDKINKHYDTMLDEHYDKINENYGKISEHYDKINKHYDTISKRYIHVNSDAVITILTINKSNNPTKKEEFDKAISLCSKANQLSKNNSNAPMDEIKKHDQDCEVAYKALKHLINKDYSI